MTVRVALLCAQPSVELPAWTTGFDMNWVPDAGDALIVDHREVRVLGRIGKPRPQDPPESEDPPLDVILRVRVEGVT